MKQEQLMMVHSAILLLRLRNMEINKTNILQHTRLPEWASQNRFAAMVVNFFKNNGYK